MGSLVLIKPSPVSLLINYVSPTNNYGKRDRNWVTSIRGDAEEVAVVRASSTLACPVQWLKSFPCYFGQLR
ncbi:hypothetical protein Hamer_G023038 [Homarus americanus]|uniref:Uncharacterized protein n=1 Tax=Homarus americanus TaxID=6706 RepID=A0A8J5TI98_HOMAM|nr:hypothetical protein Hamer_G023038 [Homarus americanus]